MKLVIFVFLLGVFAILVTPIIHLTGIFPQFFEETSWLDGELRRLSQRIELLTGIRTSGYWEIICLRTTNCEWISGSEFPEFVLYPNGLVHDPSGIRALNPD